MNPVIVLDASALFYLEHLHRFAMQHPHYCHIPHDQMPFKGLDFLLRQGCTLVLPNEVLKEITAVNSSTDRLGMGYEANGTPTVHAEYLEKGAGFGRRRHRLLMDWIQEKLVNDHAACTEHGDIFRYRQRRGELDGKLCIAAMQEPTSHDGIEHPHTRQECMDGDTEILQFLDLFPDAPGSATITLFTHDGDLINKARAKGPRIETVNTAGMCELFAMMGFVDDFTLYPEVIDILPAIRGSDRGKLRMPGTGTYEALRNLSIDWGMNRFQNMSSLIDQPGQTHQDRLMQEYRERRAVMADAGRA